MRPAAIYRALLLCYPAAFRQEYGREMELVFADELSAAAGAFARLCVWLRAARDLIVIAPQEHWHVFTQDVRYALRNLAVAPGFAAVAILSVALGIGATTAIFSLWNGIQRRALPVRAPEQLVMLTDPNSSGVSIGSSNGDRALLTYAEFEQLRDRADGFTGMMASQSAIERLQVRFADSNWEEATGRLVSGEYFQVLGAVPQLGRAFTREDDRASSNIAVISHDFWQRRFGGRRDVLGKRLVVRKAAFVVAGVAPPGFFGETAGQRPDLWIPLSAQPGVLPARDWLHDTGSEKVMWLHVFARLRPGVSVERAQASANAVFKAALAAHYGSVLSPAAAREFLNQSLKIVPAAGGASRVRARFADPLQMLLWAVGVVLLISCANVANLLLARGAARRREISLRLSLGASRGRLVRQLLTESAVLAALGGLAGLAMALLFQQALVRLVMEADPLFAMGFPLDARVLGFSFAATFVASILFGLLPAWLGTGAESGVRGGSSSASQLRWGRALVAAQLALSLPLLAGAGLLLRTLYNLRHADLGYSEERLITVRIDAQTGGYEPARRLALFQALHEQIRLAPGVRAASYSENGLFAGSDSNDEIEVEGYTPKGDGDRSSRWDQVGPDFFSAAGIPVAMGREILASDHAAAPKVCVINEAFAKRFFAGRNPLGLRITTVYGDKRSVHHVAGVVRDARTNRLRGAIPPRYFVPLAQPLEETAALTYLVRTAGEPAAVLAGVRRAIRQVDPALPILRAETMTERLTVVVAQDRIVARLAFAFGLVALALAAVGLYGVLSYGVARRRAEIGIRMALGARAGHVIAMILRETSWLLLGGLAAGAALAIGASKLIESQLYGLAQHDPLTLASAVAALLAVALAAAYIPARRAAHLDPLAALRQE